MAGIDNFAPAWMRNTPLMEIWRVAWTQNPDTAMDVVRQSEAYDEVFVGNRREDGSLRYDENTYLGIVESYEDALLSVDVNPDLFRSKFPDLIAGLVSPNEFASRVESVYENVIVSTPQVRDFYARHYSLDISDSAIIASVLDPDIGDAILNRRIAISEVGGAASARNFTIGADLAEQFVTYGVDTIGEAQTYFAQAENLIPAISTLAKRHADPDDDFDLEEFSNASLFGDPEQRRRMRRLMAQERSSFGADTALSIRQDREGSLTGLEQL